jgi:hypothetical protein
MTLKPESDSNADFIELNNFFKEDSLYIINNKEDSNIPMNLYEINYKTVDIEQNRFDILENNYFNKKKGDDLILDKIVNIKPYIVYNDAELALSIFIAFNELMPSVDEFAAPQK